MNVWFQGQTYKIFFNPDDFSLYLYSPHLWLSLEAHPPPFTLHPMPELI